MDKVQKASLDQARASDPDSSAWVSANAGSGKTHVLVNRIIRLLLTGTEPEKILCLTFTRAAAAEMSNRLFERLAEWIPLGDDELIERIHANTGHTKISKRELAAPRKLFARALETPGGLKIQTIHAFCEKLLHKFPLEAGVTPGFKVLDDRQSDELSTKVRNEFLSNLTDTSELAQVVKYAGGQKGFDELLAHVFDKRESLRPAMANPDQAMAFLARDMNISPEMTSSDITSEIVTGIDKELMRRFQAVLSTGKVDQDINKATLIGQFLQAENDNAARDAIIEILFTTKMLIRASRSMVTTGVNKTHPEILEYFQTQAERIAPLLEREKDINTLAATRALISIAAELVARYDHEKQIAGYYDFTDLEARVLGMFTQMPDAAWVLYKLDGGIEHILVDEAQDTSPRQWEIIRFLCDDFFSGEGTHHPADRTLFAVGDKKQSIYSFQGAAPREFDRQKRELQQMANQANAGFSPVDLLVSFRSTSQVLQTVDKVFSQPQAQEGVGRTVHEATRSPQTDTGLTELWPLETAQDKDKTSAWQLHDDTGTKSDPRVALAEKIAAKIKSWFDHKVMLESKDRLLTPGDILILVRTRNIMMPALVRSLKAHNVPVAGVDRLLLTDHIAIRDLLALARFTLLPQDDLNLACLLKSPLPLPANIAPIDDDDLTILAAKREASSLWNQLGEAAQGNEKFKFAYETLKGWRTLAQQLRPFEFFSTFLTCDGGRKRLLTRLGTEAGEPLDIFIEMAREHERLNTPGMQNFVSWIANSEEEVKREMAHDAGEVRVMTIHGAKGLEAPVVIIADSCEVPDGRRPPKVVFSKSGAPVWLLKTDLQAKAAKEQITEHKREDMEEYNRLLYVAMTRARDRLYIAGARKQKNLNSDCWYKLIADQLEKDEHRVDDDIFGSVWRYGKAPRCDTQITDDTKTTPAHNQLPDWITRMPDQPETRDRWVSPSHLSRGDEGPPEMHVSALAISSENRFLRGNIIHSLLQYLPALAHEKRAESARAYIDRHADTLDEKTRETTLREVLDVLDHPDFADIFSPQSMAEVPILGEITLPGGKRKVINGQIDRLFVTDTQVFIIDYKTNRPPPEDISDVAESYIRQLGAYRQVLCRLYRDRKVRAALLWTYNATLMEIPAAMMDAQ